MNRNASLWGTRDHSSDVNEGTSALSDGYFLAAIHAASENDETFKKVFAVKQTNIAGIYAFNVYVRGVPTIVTVDDKVPIVGSWFDDRPLFANLGSDGSFWPLLLEKAFAKVYKNYEGIHGGNIGEGFAFLYGTPSTRYPISTLSINALWSMVKSADDKNHLMGVTTGSEPNYGLPLYHTFTLVGVQ